MKTAELEPLLSVRPSAPVYVIGTGITGCILAERVDSLFERPVGVLEERNAVGGYSRAEIAPVTGIGRYLAKAERFPNPIVIG